MTESEITALGFEHVESYDHDQYHTNRYENGDLEVEFTYEDDKLIDVDLTIEEVNCKPITREALQKIVPVLGYRAVSVPPIVSDEEVRREEDTVRGKIVYIAHPTGGDVTANLEKIIAIVRKINLEQPEIVPLVPYFVDCIALDDDNPAQRAKGLSNGKAVLRSGAFDEIWLYGDRISDGMWGEIDVCHGQFIKVVPQTEGTVNALNAFAAASGINYY